MCKVFYTMYKCSHWFTEMAPPGGPDQDLAQDKYVFLCETASKYRLGNACPYSERVHEVKHLSKGLCPDCIWEKIKQ